MDRDPAIQAIIDEQAIRRVLLLYSRGVDRMDWPLVRDCFHPDAYLEYGPAPHDVESIIEMLQASGGARLFSQHLLVNILIEVEGDIAWSEAYCVAPDRHPGHDGGPDTDSLWIGRYVDRFERRDGAWRIAHRVVVNEWSRVGPAGPSWPRVAGFAQAQRSKEDPLYRLRAAWQQR